MADTLGSMIDKICTINQKMFMAQEELYVIRRMTFDEFKEAYGSSDEGLEKLYNCFKKSCDLNVQRQNLISEFDEKAIEIMKSAANGDDLDDGKFVQRQHKTY